MTYFALVVMALILLFSTLAHTVSGKIRKRVNDVLPWGQIAGLGVCIRLYSEEKLCFKHKLINL